MKALVVNCSAPSYNLGANKLANYLREQGYSVDWYTGGFRNEPDGNHGEPLLPLMLCGYDLVCISAIFSWHVDRAINVANVVKHHSEVWCGGPAFNASAARFTQATSIDVPFVWRTINDKLTKVHGAPDPRFDRQRGDYRMIYAMRGCPVGCSFCIVWRVEGTKFVLDRDFQPTKMLMDNNLSAPDIDLQEHIIQRYEHSGVPLLDANSGFEPRTFDEGTYERWSRIMRGPWRFASDEIDELDDVKRMMSILRTRVRSRLIRPYCLLGREPVRQCLERARRIIDWGGEPFTQVFIPLNYRFNPERMPPPALKDWQNPRAPYDMRRYFNSPQIWRTTSLHEYKPRTNEAPPFAFLKPRRMITSIVNRRALVHTH